MATVATAVAVVSAAVLVALASPAFAAGSADVRFVEPDKFLDAGRSPHDRERVLAALTAHLQRLAQALPDGQKLRVDFLDVDLAGHEELRRGSDVRIVRGSADWPRLHVRWALEQGGSTLKSGQDRLADLDYTMTARMSAASGELPYEKRMLTEWFEKQVEGKR
jgi:hypothetical protein